MIYRGSCNLYFLQTRRKEKDKYIVICPPFEKEGMCGAQEDLVVRHEIPHPPRRIPFPFTQSVTGQVKGDKIKQFSH